MTQAQQSALYGPVAEDLILVEDLLESVKRVELAPLRLMLEHALEPRGKRLRPALVLLAGTFGDYNLNRLVPLGTAIELLHTASLVHDDVVDGAESRRGRPTANSVFDNALTVLLGDFMFATAAEMVTRTGSLPVTRLFALALMKMTTGELDQDAAAFDVGRDIQHYLWRIGGKTAALFGHSTQGGALLAECTDSQVEALRSYGYNIGMAFQIVDDILDFTGDEGEMGKPAGGDLLEGTITLPALFYLESAPQRNPVRQFLSSDQQRAEMLPEALSAVVQSDAIQRSQAMAQEFIDRALEGLSGLEESPAHRTLKELSGYVLSRRS
ncbi:MAG: heptaprenyl diphosphate synthase [Dehalococcoidia bacterium]|nr:heptaprenyl diphosphate synthase [Dehalococcoidia bacterium]|tara:strand:- start:114 stop:1091 length:978 start_codon:yes stop_codon:yes gene_type:complete